MRVGLRQRAAEDREVLREDEGLAPVNKAMSGDETVAGNLVRLHREIAAAVSDQLVELFESPVVEQKLYPLARRHLAFFVLALDPLRAAARFGRGVLFA